jgi:hypothetical protein
MNVNVLPRTRMNVDEFLAYTCIMRDGDIALAASGISVPVAALLGPSSAGGEVDRP